jgi:hypothetical protein
MKSKLSIILFSFILMASISSCSNDGGTSSYDKGKAKGTEFITAYNSYKNASSDLAGAAIKATAGATMYADYTAYSNSTDAEWKNGFLLGAGLTVGSQQLAAFNSISVSNYTSLFTSLYAIFN